MDLVFGGLRYSTAPMKWSIKLLNDLWLTSDHPLIIRGPSTTDSPRSVKVSEKGDLEMVHESFSWEYRDPIPELPLIGSTLGRTEKRDCFWSRDPPFWRGVPLRLLNRVDPLLLNQVSLFLVSVVPSKFHYWSFPWSRLPTRLYFEMDTSPCLCVDFKCGNFVSEWLSDSELILLNVVVGGDVRWCYCSEVIIIIPSGRLFDVPCLRDTLSHVSIRGFDPPLLVSSDDILKLLKPWSSMLFVICVE